MLDPDLQQVVKDMIAHEVTPEGQRENKARNGLDFMPHQYAEPHLHLSDPTFMPLSDEQREDYISKFHEVASQLQDCQKFSAKESFVLVALAVNNQIGQLNELEGANANHLDAITRLSQSNDTPDVQQWQPIKGVLSRTLRPNNLV